MMKLAYFCTFVWLTCVAFHSRAEIGEAAERQKLSDMPPQLAEKSLKKLVQDIDSDGSQGLSLQEMAEWMMRLEKTEAMKGLHRDFHEADRNHNGYVTLAEFAHTMANFDDALRSTMDEVLAYSRPIFDEADGNKDGQLTIEEYGAFIHPELHIHMVDVLVDMFLEQYDNNDDGAISFYEFMGIYMPKTAEQRGNLPNWAEQTRAMFTDELDKNKNGMLERDEMAKWVTAEVTHSAHTEASHLLFQADKDNDGELSHSEALSELDLIANSWLTQHHHISHEEL